MSQHTLHKFVDLFRHEKCATIENFDEVKIVLQASSYRAIDAYAFETGLGFLNSRDKAQVSVLIGENDPVDYYSSDPVQSFILDLSRAMGSREDEPIRINLTVFKKQDKGSISVYSLTDLQAFLEQLSLQNLLAEFSKCFRECGIIKLENQIPGPVITTGAISLADRNHDVIPGGFINRAKVIELAKTAGYSNFFTQYSLLPDDFILKEVSHKHSLESVLNRLAIVGSIAYLFDIISIEGSAISFKLNGYKSIQGTVDFTEVKTDPGHQYENIYNWVYNSGNFTDKLGLARNIISLHLIPLEKIKLNGSPFSSLSSAYKVYEKENIKQYISIRNSLSDQLLSFHDRANTLAESFAGNLQKSGLALISFYISVIILKVLSKDHLVNVFTLDTAFFSTAILLCSFAYFWFSRWDLNKQKERFVGHYFDLKRRYLDLLDRQDIDRILNNDREYSEDILFINAKLKMYSKMWLNILLLFFVTTWLLFFWYK